MLSKLLSESDNIEYYNDIEDDRKLLSQMSGFRFCISLDWKHCVSEDEFYEFIQYRAKLLIQCNINRNGMSASELFSIVNKRPKDGDWHPFLFKYYDKLLAKYQLGLINLDVDDDAYNIFVVRRENISKLQRTKSDIGAFKRI